MSADEKPMTVAELAKALAAFPPDAIIELDGESTLNLVFVEASINGDGQVFVTLYGGERKRNPSAGEKT
jgi:hypothetical protein